MRHVTKTIILRRGFIWNDALCGTSIYPVILGVPIIRNMNNSNEQDQILIRALKIILKLRGWEYS